MKQQQALEGVCAWPNLTLLPDGQIVAAIFNQPCHGMWEGDLDCWVSKDEGIVWQFRGCIAPHAPGTNRMNCAAGLATNGDIVVSVGGWSHRDVPGKPCPHQPPAAPLRAWICRSSDKGANWKTTGELPSADGRFPFVPFGDLQTAADGALCLSSYVMNDDRNGYSAHLLRSYDDGYSWQDATCINPVGDETAVVHLGNGRWLAASRQTNLSLFMSEDDGRSWQESTPLTLPRQITGHLLQLRDGRVLLSYGSRREGEFGVEAKLSIDSGRSWSTPYRLADMLLSDGGDPSSVQLSDGSIVTAYYAQKPGEYQYEMNVIRWDPAKEQNP